MEGKRRAILFDADNTLYQTHYIAKAADLAAMRVLAKQCSDGKSCCTPNSLYTQFRKIVALIISSHQPYRRTRQHSYSLLVARHSISRSHLRAAYAEFQRTVLQKLKLMPGVLAFLNAANHQGFKLGIITEDRRTLAMAKLRKLNVRKQFHCVITADTIGTMKPNPKYFDLACKKLKVVPHNCIVLGDHYEKDLAYPKQCGAFTILIGAKDTRADKSVQSYKGLQKYLR